VHHADHGGRAAHVALHVFHARGRLDRNAAGVEDDALADEADRLLLLVAFSPVPHHHRHARRPLTALPDAEQRAHFHLFHLLDVEDLDFDTEFLERLGLLGKFNRAQNVGRLVDQIASEVDAVDDGFERLECSLGLVGMGHVDDELSQAILVLGHLFRRLLGQIFLESVMAQHGALCNQRRDHLGLQLIGAVDVDQNRGRRPFAALKLSEDRTAKIDELLLGQSCGLANAAHDQPVDADFGRSQDLYR